MGLDEYLVQDHNQPPPTRFTLQQVTAEREALCRWVNPPGDIILVDIDPLLIDEYIPTEEEIGWAMIRL